MKSVMKSKGSSDPFGDFLSNCVRDSVEAREYTQAEVDALKAKAESDVPQILPKVGGRTP